jgi:hypothetical protein
MNPLRIQQHPASASTAALKNSMCHSIPCVIQFHMSYLLPLSEGSGHVEHDANASFRWIRNENGNQEGH